jgi:hypothetical protein
MTDPVNLFQTKVLPSHPNVLRLLICFSLILATCIAFWQIQANDFLNLDDNLYVLDNPHIQDGVSLRGILWAFTEVYAGHWHPLAWLSHMLDIELFALKSGGHHMTSLIIHTINTILLFLLFQRMTGALWRSASVAALFALHPLHVESVAWVAERKDLLCAFFWILTLWAYSSYVKTATFSRYLLTVLCFVLALMSKPMAVTLPFVLLLLDFWPLDRFRAEKENGKRIVFHLVFEKIPLILLGVILSLFTLYTHSKGGTVASFDNSPLNSRIENALISYIRYIVKMFWPDPLAVLYPYPSNPLLSEVTGAILLLIIITFLVILARRNHPYFLTGWLWYLGTLVPVIGLVQAGLQSIADRFTYIPLIGLFFAIVYGIQDALKGSRFQNVVFISTGI